MPNMRAKVYVNKVTQYSGSSKVVTQEELFFVPVSSKPYGPNGESEDNTFARYTPSGELRLSVTNPELIGKFKGGDTFYVDFTPVAAE